MFQLSHKISSEKQTIKYRFEELLQQYKYFQWM